MAPFDSEFGSADWTAKRRPIARRRPSAITAIKHVISAPERSPLGRAIYEADSEQHVRSWIKDGVAYGSVDSIGLARVRKLRDGYLAAPVASVMRRAAA